MLAAMETNIPTARVASTNTKAEARIPTLASEPLDAIRQEAGLHPDSGETLHSEPAFTSFPPSLDGDAPQAGMVAPFRVRLAKEGHEPGRDVPAWAVDDGRPLVFLTFGTLAAGFEHTHVLFRAAIEAAGGLQVRAVFSTGAAMEATRLGAIPGNVTVTPWVDQVDVYPHASLLVCHGGAGTVLAGVTYGLPMVITPISADQPDNARMMENAGAAIVVAEPDAESLRAAMSRGLSDKKMRAAAGQIADEMASMPSIDEAVRELEGIGLN